MQDSFYQYFQIYWDTGGNNFDKLVLNQEDGVKLLGTKLFSNTKRSGVDWNGGNVKFVNLNERKLLGQDIGATDKGVTIPLKNIFDLISSLVNSNNRQTK